MFKLSFSLLLLSCSALYAQKKPNIILIMADDMGYECVGANGSTFYKTPNLDRLAADGVRFEHAYSQPICTPSRVKIMTGRYNARNYVKFGYLHPNEITFGNIMQKAGYKTCIAGKWQLGGDFEAPTKFGFDEYCLWQLTHRPPRYSSPSLEINSSKKDFPGKYGPDIVSDYIIDFAKRNKDQPFFAYYPMMLPHWPHQPTPDSADWNPNDKEWSGKGAQKWTVAHFQDMVTYADKIVGKIDKALGEMGIRENTLLIFTCDNGTGRNITSPFKGKKIPGGKSQTNNYGTHVPFIASWPGTIKGGEVSQALIDFSDFVPTFAEIGGAELPQDRVIDGRSFLPLLKGDKKNIRDWVFCWYHKEGNRSKATRFARNQTYKLYHNGRFYDISADELEKNTIKPGQIQVPEVRKKLQSVIDKIHAEEKDFPYKKEKTKTKKKAQG